VGVLEFGLWIAAIEVKTSQTGSGHFAETSEFPGEGKTAVGWWFVREIPALEAP
jgi:hypothetical protein